MKSLLTVRYIHHCQRFFFNILSKEKSHSIGDDFFFLTTLISNHLPLHVSTSCIWRLKYTNWSCKAVSIRNWSVYKLSIGCCILLAWEIFFPPLNQHSTNMYLNKSKTSSVHIFFSHQNGIDKGIIPCWEFSLFLLSFSPCLKVYEHLLPLFS